MVKEIENQKKISEMKQKKAVLPSICDENYFFLKQIFIFTIQKAQISINSQYFFFEKNLFMENTEINRKKIYRIFKGK